MDSPVLVGAEERQRGCVCYYRIGWLIIGEQHARFLNGFFNLKKKLSPFDQNYSDFPLNRKVVKLRRRYSLISYIGIRTALSSTIFHRSALQ